MAINGGEYSLSDIAAVTEGNRNNGMFGNGDWGLWIVLFLILGWGNGGYGGFAGGRSGGVADQYVLTSDFATIQRQLSDGFSGVEKGIDTIRNGLCDGFYTEAQLINGVNMNIAQNGYESRLATTNLGSQVAQCCCDIRSEIANVNFANAQNTCAITGAISTSTRDIIDNQNANYRALHDEIVANRIEDKNAQIAAQQNEINALRLAASQQAQNAYLVSELGYKCPQPAYVVQPPQQVTFPTNCCGGVSYANVGCGCGA